MNLKLEITIQTETEFFYGWLLNHFTRPSASEDQSIRNQNHVICSLLFLDLVLKPRKSRSCARLEGYSHIANCYWIHPQSTAVDAKKPNLIFHLLEVAKSKAKRLGLGASLIFSCKIQIYR